MTTNQTDRVSDEELDQMILKLERDGMTPKMLSLMRELREVRRAKSEPVAWIVHARTGDQLTTDSGYVANAEGILGLHSTPLYTAPPAPPAYKKTENFTDYHAGWNACRAAMLQAGNSRETPDEAYFWDWLRDKMPTTYRWSRELEDTPENSALITKGKASALDMLSAWKGCSAAMLNHSGNSEQLEPVSNRDELPAKCWCQTCRPVTMNDMRFVVCPECGNKRCPRANDHRNACTGSNAPGQDGSAYPAAPKEVG